MASISMLFIRVAFLVVVCLMIMKEASDCNASGKPYGCFFTDRPAGFPAVVRHNRRVLDGLKGKKVVIFYGTQMRKSNTSPGKNDNVFNSWELRKVPSGPDPLHHNGNSPKKPRSP